MGVHPPLSFPTAIVDEIPPEAKAVASDMSTVMYGFPISRLKPVENEPWLLLKAVAGMKFVVWVLLIYNISIYK